MVVLNITILFTGSLPSRIYLAMLKKNDFLPKKIIHLKFNTRNKFEKSEQLVSEQLAKIILEPLPLSYEHIQLNPVDYCKQYTSIEIKSLGDTHLRSLLAKENCKTFLFTGGGILNEDILSIKNSKFIHIHPGILPDIKGADGLFWSYLLRKKLGYSCFYMNKGIDTGNIMHIEEFNIQNFDVQALINFDKRTIYKALLQYYDPVLRAQTLLNLIHKTEKQNFDLHNVPYTIQNQHEGRTYFFMHENLRNHTLELILKPHSN